MSKSEIKQLLIFRQATEVKELQQWEESLGQRDSEYWKQKFISARKTTKEVKLQVFQYKLIVRRLPTRLRLFKMNQVQKPICTLCNDEEIETLEHYLVLCPEIGKFWKVIIDWFEKMESTTFNIRQDHCVFGIETETKDELIEKWNEIALWAWFFIYKNRLKETQPNLTAFKSHIKSKLKILGVCHCPNK